MCVWPQVMIIIISVIFVASLWTIKDTLQHQTFIKKTTATLKPVGFESGCEGCLVLYLEVCSLGGATLGLE